MAKAKRKKPTKEKSIPAKQAAETLWKRGVKTEERMAKELKKLGYDFAPSTPKRFIRRLKEHGTSYPEKSASKKSTGKKSTPQVAILMGSKSDWGAMEAAAKILKELKVAHEVRVVSAHRTPERHRNYMRQAEAAGVQVFICGAGMAAHLAGVTAAETRRPVLGVPLEGGLLGLDSLLATAQMPGGIPVGTLGIGKHGAKNAALLAVAILSLSDSALDKRLCAFRKAQTAAVPHNPF